MSTRTARAGALAALAALVAAALAACGARPESIPPTTRLITMAAVEPRGGVTVDREPYPRTALPQGGGYILREPDTTGRWEVSAYRWDPSQVMVNQGDDVTLEIVGINGAEHPSVIEGYDLKFNVKRGQVTRVSFKADKAGVFKINCAAHFPSMIGEVIVLPRA